MRSTDEMKRLVQREAAHRRSRRHALVSGGVGAIALVLITAAVARAGTGGSAEVSTGTDGTPPAASVTPSSTGSTAPEGQTSATTVIVVDESGDTVVVIPSGGGSPTTAPRSTATGPTTVPGPSTDGPATTATPAPTSAPPPVGPDPTTPEDGTPPLTILERECTSDDIVRTPLQIFVPSAPGWTGGAIPLGHVVQFGYSTLARTDITPCRTPDSLQVLSIADANGTEVFRHTYDGGPGRLITPGSWVMFRGSVTWDPSCATPEPFPFVWTCTAVGAGNYTVRLTDQGVVYGPGPFSIAGP